MIKKDKSGANVAEAESGNGQKGRSRKLCGGQISAELKSHK
jgi:hypothetical protein